MAKPQFDHVLAHWATVLENFNTSSLEFFNMVEAALTRRTIPEIRFSRINYSESGVLSAKREYLRVSRHHLQFDICAAPFGTGFFFSWWQVRPPLRFGLLFGLILTIVELYLTWTIFKYLPQHDFARFLPFWWRLGLAALTAFVAFLFLCLLAASSDNDVEDFLLPIPGVGGFYRWAFKPDTYYELDTMAMYRGLVHAAVMEVVDGLTTAKGVRALADDQRMPIMRDFWK